MRKNYSPNMKPRFNRSKLKILKGEEAKDIKKGRAYHLVSKDLHTKWKTPVSDDTYEYLIENNLLSEEQIKVYKERKFKLENKKIISRIFAKTRTDSEMRLLKEIASLDVKTEEGSKAFTAIIRKNPMALYLIEDADILRAIGYNWRKL